MSEERARSNAAPDRAIPALPALDLDAALTFYQRLGFVVSARYRAEGYAILQRGTLELHLWTCSDRHVAENSGCYLRVQDARALHTEFAQERIERLLPLEAKPWGLLEFAVIDPSGCLLRIGTPL